MTVFLGLIRWLSFVLHLPMMAIAYNGLVFMFFSIVIPIAMFDILEEVSEDGAYLPFLKFLEEYPEHSMPALIELGYESNNAILNLSTLAVTFFA